MSPALEQIHRENRYDVIVAVISVVLFFGLGLCLPRWAFWLWFLPIAAFWIRWNVVRLRRDRRLLQADLATDDWRGPTGCYRSEAGICISDGREQVLVGRQKPHSPVQLIEVRGRK